MVFALIRTLLPNTTALFIPSLLSSLCSNVTISMKPSLNHSIYNCRPLSSIAHICSFYSSQQLACSMCLFLTLCPQWVLSLNKGPVTAGFLPILLTDVFPSIWSLTGTCTHVRCVASVVSDSLWPVGCSPPGSSVCGVLQARMLEWVAMPFSRGSSQPRDETRLCLLQWQAGSIQLAPLGKPIFPGVCEVVT